MQKQEREPQILHQQTLFLTNILPALRSSGESIKKIPIFKSATYPSILEIRKILSTTGFVSLIPTGKRKLSSKKSWWDRHEKKDPDGEGKNEEPDKGKKKRK